MKNTKINANLDKYFIKLYKRKIKLDINNF